MMLAETDPQMGDRRVLVRCATLGCVGVLGSFATRQFIPSAHLVGGRDWYVTPEAVVLICAYCHTRYLLRPDAGRLQVNRLTP